MDRIKIKDAATEQGMKPEELVARLREAGIEKTVKGSLSPEEYEKVKVKKSEASVEVVRKDVIIRRRSKPAAAEAPAAPVVEEKAAPAEAAPASAPEASPVEAKAAPAPEKAPKKARSPREAAPVARIVRPARVVTPEPAPAAVVVAPAASEEKKVEKPVEKAAEKPVQAAAVVVEARAEEPRQDKAVRARKVDVPAARIVTPKPAPVEAKPAAAEEKPAAEVKADATRGDRPRRAPAASAEPEGSSQPSLLPPVQERRHAPEEGEGEDSRKGAARRCGRRAPRARDFPSRSHAGPYSAPGFSFGRPLRP